MPYSVMPRERVEIAVVYGSATVASREARELDDAGHGGGDCFVATVVGAVARLPG